MFKFPRLKFRLIMGRLTMLNLNQVVHLLCQHLQMLHLLSIPKMGYIYYFYTNQYDIGRRGCTLMSSLPKANWNGQTGKRAGRRAGTSKYRDACASKNIHIFASTSNVLWAYVKSSNGQNNHWSQTS